jgi:hypothetical protein
MNITAIDWAIVVGYFALSTVIGFIFTKRGGESLEEYFLSGRQVPWWLAGAAMVATTFRRRYAARRDGTRGREGSRRQLAVVEHGHERNAHRVLLRPAVAPCTRDDGRGVRRDPL